MNFNFKKLALATLTIQEYKIPAFSYHFKVVTFPYLTPSPQALSLFLEDNFTV